MKRVLNKKLLIGLTVTAGVIISIPFVFYLKVLPYAVSNTKVINYVEKSAKNSLKLTLI